VARVVIVGGGTLAMATTRLLVRRGHEVVVVERDGEAAERLGASEECGVVHGDGTRPAVLADAGPDETDVLLALTGDAQTNLIAGLVGRSVGFGRVVTRIEDEEFEHVALGLGLTDTIVPARTIGRYLTDMVEGRDVLELSSAIKSDARVFTFVAREQDAGPVESLDLPEGARVSHLYRDGAFRIADPKTEIRVDDEVVLLSHRSDLEEIEGRFGASNATDAS
jgi:trk system potassium uptake protein TrkA